MADAPPAPEPQHYDTPYLVRQPDGSTATRILRTDRPLMTNEVAEHVARQGGIFAGYPEAPSGPPAPAPSRAPAPADVARIGGGYELGAGAPLAAAVTQTAPPGPPAVEPVAAAPLPPPPPGMERLKGAIFPQRTFASQVPSILGATAFGTTAAGLAAPVPPLVIPAGAAGAALGGAIGEGTQILGEKITGEPPAEPGSAWERMGNAAFRGGAAELATAPLRVPFLIAGAKAAPVLQAAEELRPILTGTAETAAPAAQAAHGAAEQLAAQEAAALPRWWAQVSAGKPEQIVKAWNDLGPEGQAALAGKHLEAMQTVIDTIAEGAEKWGKMGPGVTLGGLLTGQPLATVAGAVPTAIEAVSQGIPKALSWGVRTPEAVPYLLALPKVGQVAGPLVSVPLRAGSQSVAANAWPATEVVFPERESSPR